MSTALQKAHAGLISDMVAAGFRDFVAQEYLQPSNALGPGVLGGAGSGVFRSQIQNRAPIVDLEKDLSVRMGIERIPINFIQEIEGEFGPSGERVFYPVSDAAGLVRLYGRWGNLSDSNGARAHINNADPGFIEIVFWGTGLNLFYYFDGTSRPIFASVDGAAEGGDLYKTGSSVLQNRNYNANVTLPIVSGLAPGIHTVRLRFGGGGSSTNVYGIEILREATALQVQPGTSYVDGQRISVAAAQTPAYNSSFESGVLGTRGGRVLVYQKADGTVAKALTPTNIAQQNLGAADHANEEIVRTYHFREFGYFRIGEDVTSLTTISDRGYTLDDGSTTLLLNDMAATTEFGIDAFFHNAVNSYFTLTFVGTGLDLGVLRAAVLTDNYQIFVDGVQLTAGPTSGATLFPVANNGIGVTKIVSGLPYGTHTVMVLRNTTGGVGVSFNKFHVYGPKKPALPAGAVELGEYFLLGNYVPNATGGSLTIASGVLRKVATREFFYSGTWVVTAIDANTLGGFTVNTGTNGSYVEIVFWGTGVEIRPTMGGTNTSTISVDGSTDLTGFSTATYFTGGGTFSLNPATGVLTQSGTSGQFGMGVRISGMSLGKHVVRITLNSATNSFQLDAIDVITPIHVQRNENFTNHNFLEIGSQGVRDLRALTAIPEERKLGWSQAQAINVGVSTTATVYVPMADMTTTLRTFGGPIEVEFYGSFACTSTTAGLLFKILVDGIDVIAESAANQDGAQANGAFTTSMRKIVPVSPGFHTVQVWWLTGGGTLTAQSNRRTLTAKELKL